MKTKKIRSLRNPNGVFDFLFINIIMLSTYKEVIGNLNPIISCHINDLSVDNFPVSTY